MRTREDKSGRPQDRQAVNLDSAGIRDMEIRKGERRKPSCWTLAVCSTMEVSSSHMPKAGSLQKYGEKAQCEGGGYHT